MSMVVAPDDCTLCEDSTLCDKSVGLLRTLLKHFQRDDGPFPSFFAQLPPPSFQWSPPRCVQWSRVQWSPPICWFECHPQQVYIKDEYYNIKLRAPKGMVLSDSGPKVVVQLAYGKSVNVAHSYTHPGDHFDDCIFSYSPDEVFEGESIFPGNDTEVKATLILHLSRTGEPHVSFPNALTLYRYPKAADKLKCVHAVSECLHLCGLKTAA